MLKATLKLNEKVKGTRLTPLRFSHTIKGKSRKSYFLFRCECGVEKVLGVPNVKRQGRDQTKSCGCLMREKSRERALKRTEGQFPKGNEYYKLRKKLPTTIFKKGDVPWNKGFMRIDYPNGSYDFIPR